MGADRASMLAGEKSETRSIYLYRRDGGATDSTDERTLSSIGKKNRHEPSKTAHRLVTCDRLLTTSWIVSRRERFSGGITFD